MNIESLCNLCQRHPSPHHSPMKKGSIFSSKKTIQTSLSFENQHRWTWLLLAILIIAPLNLYASPALAKKAKVGWLEKVRVFPGQLLMHAKIDTGADNSSIHATDITPFKKGDEAWVRFTLTSFDGQTKIMERPIFRTTQITRHGVPDEDRLVVLLGICLDSIYKEDMEVNLANRGNFEYKMLIGRSFLRGEVLVDPSKEFVHEPQCFPE
jgi:hypothetical protein